MDTAQISFEDSLRDLAAHVPPGTRLRTVDELESSIEGILERHEPGSNVHVFGYGSLMWNPGFEFTDTHAAKVHGWHRSYCLRSSVGRGTPDQPGLMLGLDRGGACSGLILQIEARKARNELRLLWKREMLMDVYEPRWVTARVDGCQVPAITFTVNRSHPRYVSSLCLSDMAHMINTGVGRLGSCREYFDSTVQKLIELGIRDVRIEKLRSVID